MLKNTDILPKVVIPVLQRHVRILLDALGEKLTGVYVHGSAAMGCFTPMQSDFDYLAVVSDALTPEERKYLSDSFLAIYGKDVPIKGGVEMSIVIEKFAGKDFRYPTPYEFHMSTEEQVKAHGAPHEYEKVDYDLAAHFTITKKRGICVYGKLADEVFADVPREHYLGSIALDSADSFENIMKKTGAEKCVAPKYAVLNFCRVLALIEDDLITSKLEGGEWALRKLPEEYHSIISAALQEYSEIGSSEKVDPSLLKRFAIYARDRIREVTG
jgi:predicted nucleotidyltransferase